MSDVLTKIESGEIVSSRSPLALDEMMVCKRCNARFTMDEALYEDGHPKYPMVKRHGFKCPNCQRVNIAYYKSPTLCRLEKAIYQKPVGKVRDRARRRYERVFKQEQRFYREPEIYGAV